MGFLGKTKPSKSRKEKMTTQSSFIEKKVPDIQQTLVTPLLKQEMKLMINFMCLKSDEERFDSLVFLKSHCTHLLSELPTPTPTLPKRQNLTSKEAQRRQDRPIITLRIFSQTYFSEGHTECSLSSSYFIKTEREWNRKCKPESHITRLSIAL